MSPSDRQRMQADLDAANKMAAVMATLTEGARRTGPTVQTRSCTCTRCATCRSTR